MHSESEARGSFQSASLSFSVTELVDVERLHQISGGDSEFEVELLQSFLEDFQERLLGAKQAVEQQAWNQLSQEAHQMKGSAANLGIFPLQHAAAEVEQQVKAATFNGIPELLVTIEAELEKLRIVVESGAIAG
ncbi:MAG: Hpt domain-containing protein [Coleofasciculaceae cyanobacterium SM2_3_26]|nr:Hpt domain-containing protein [Coleofasciculaceae cyanobacterium SM2_3_26]